MNRWQKWTGQQATLASTGQSYADVTLKRAQASEGFGYDRELAAGFAK